MSDYFSDRENGPRARTDQAISPLVWAGLVALVQGLINSGAFPMTAQADEPRSEMVPERRVYPVT